MSARIAIRLCLFLLTCAVVPPSTAPGAERPTYTRAEAALDLATYFRLPHTDDPKSLYGLAHGVFPGGYDGKDHLSFQDQACTLEVLVVALVRYAGWDVLHYSPKVAAEVLPHVTPEGIPWYGPDPTPRSVPSVVVALEKGLLGREQLPGLRKPISREDALACLRKLDHLDGSSKQVDMVRWLTVEECRSPQSLSASPPNPSQLLVVPRNAPRGTLFADLPNPILDLRAPSLRLSCGPGELNTGRQDYFPLGPLQTVLTTSLGIAADSYVHQGEAIYGRVENASSTANAVGIWGASVSRAAKARVWGGFFTAENSPGDDHDAQLVGLEVDVTNKARPGVFPHASKVGIQVVGIGKRVTNAVEVIGSEDALWENGINFAERSIAPEGTAIAMTQPGPANIGIDFGHTPFRTAAMVVSNNSLLGFCSKTGGLSGLYADDRDFGYLVLRPGFSGLRITNHVNSENLLQLTPQGDLLVKGRVLSGGENPVSGDRGASKSERRLIKILVAVTSLNSTALLVLLGAWLWRRRTAKSS
jgi:hypothetical protein